MIAFSIIKNNYSTRACWISNNYNHFGATRVVGYQGASPSFSRPVGYLSYSAPSLYANLRVPTRIYDVEGGAIFSKNSTFVFFDGAAWNPRLRSPSPIMALTDELGFVYCLYTALTGGNEL